MRSLRFLLSIHEDARQDDKNINFKILIDLGSNKEDGVISTYVVVKNTNKTCRNHKENERSKKFKDGIMRNFDVL